jgi:hypothetical protein
MSEQESVAAVDREKTPLKLALAQARKADLG